MPPSQKKNEDCIYEKSKNMKDLINESMKDLIELQTSRMPLF